MRLFGFVTALLLAAVLYSPPASAQGVGVYVGPGGVGVDVGPRPPPRGQGYYDDRRQYRGDGYYRPAPRCRWVYVQRGPYTERVRECY